MPARADAVGRGERWILDAMSFGESGPNSSVSPGAHERSDRMNSFCRGRGSQVSKSRPGAPKFGTKPIGQRTSAVHAARSRAAEAFHGGRSQTLFWRCITPLAGLSGPFTLGEPGCGEQVRRSRAGAGLQRACQQARTWALAARNPCRMSRRGATDEEHLFNAGRSH